ncbi:hypothetical protein Tco_0596961 [Tanacetum coccineum]
MANFPRLQELAFAANSTTLTDTMSVYIEREINVDLDFVLGLSKLWDAMYHRVNDHKLFIVELQYLGGVLALKCVDFPKQMGQNDVLKLLEVTKIIANVHLQVHRKIDFLTVKRPRPNRQAIWYYCPVHRYIMGHTNDRGVVVDGRASGVVGQGFIKGNTTIAARGDYVICLHIRSGNTTIAGIGGVSMCIRHGSGSITQDEVIHNSMSP